MNDRPIARPAFGCLNPRVFLQTGVHGEPLVIQDAARRHLELLIHREDLFRLADLPALHELHRRRHVFLVPLRGSRVDPREQGVDFLLRQSAVVEELAVSRVGIPRRHPLLDERLANAARALLRVVEGQERERPDLIRRWQSWQRFCKMGRVLGVGHFCGARLLGPFGHAARCLGPRVRDRLVRE